MGVEALYSDALRKRRTRVMALIWPLRARELALTLILKLSKAVRESPRV
jgi:hypothetical protein